MQLHAGDRYQLQPGAQLRFGALLCRVQFSHQPVPPSEEDDRGDLPDQAPTVAVDPDTQVPRCDLTSSIGLTTAAADSMSVEFSLIASPLGAAVRTDVATHSKYRDKSPTPSAQCPGV